MTAAAPAFGYSGKPLAAKLGVKPGMRVAAIEAPAHYAALLAGLPEGAQIDRSPDAGPYPLVHLFAADAAALSGSLAVALALVGPGGALWISWPKKASPLFRDLTEDGIRRVVLPTGFVDVKICAVDPDWSGLKFLRRRGT